MRGQTVSLRRLCLALVSVAVLQTCDSWGHKGRLTIVNGSEESIRNGRVVVCGQRLALDNLGPRRARVFMYKVNCEGGYDITATFASGVSLKRETGYVTTGMDFSDELIVKPTGI